MKTLHNPYITDIHFIKLIIVITIKNIFPIIVLIGKREHVEGNVYLFAEQSE